MCLLPFHTYESLCNPVPYVRQCMMYQTVCNSSECAQVRTAIAERSLLSIAMFLTLLLTLLLALPIIYILRSVLLRTPLSSAEHGSTSAPQTKKDEQTGIMQAERSDLAPPRDDPFTLEQLKAFDGSDEAKPLYVSIKGTCALVESCFGSAR